jgi:hypothetical protein
MNKAVYIASPLSGDIEGNTEFARKCLRDSILRGEAPYASHLLYTQILDDSSIEQRRLGMDAGLIFLRRCDLFVAYLDNGWSKGMLEEKRLAEQCGISIEERYLNKLME